MLHEAAERLLKEDECNAALELYRLALKEEADKDAIHGGMGRCYNRKGKHGDACACFEKLGCDRIAPYAREYAESAVLAGRRKEASERLKGNALLELADLAEAWLPKYGLTPDTDFMAGLCPLPESVQTALVAVLRKEPRPAHPYPDASVKALLSRFGTAGFVVYHLMNEPIGDALIAEGGIREEKLNEIMDFMDGLGMVDLKELDELCTSGVRAMGMWMSRWEEDALLRRLKGRFGDGATRIYDLTSTRPTAAGLIGQSSMEKSKVSTILKFLEEEGGIAYDCEGRIINVAWLATTKPLMRRLYDKYGANGIRVYCLIDGILSVEQIKEKSGAPNTEQIIDFMVRWEMAVIDSLDGKQTPFMPSVVSQGYLCPLFYSDKEVRDCNPHFRRAFKYHLQGWWLKAHEEYGEATDAEEGRAEYHVNRGALYYSGSMFQEAAREFTRAIDINSADFKASYNLALCLASQERYTQAAETMSRAIRIKPEDADAYHARGLSFEYGGDFKRAIADYEKALELKPDNENAKLHLEAARRKANEAVEKEYAEVTVAPLEFRPKTTLADIGGMKKLKEKIAGLLLLLKDPAAAKEYGVGFGGGVVFYGPPGCGKSFVVEAIAGEAGVTFVKTSIAEILNKYIGNSEKNLHDAFEAARKKQPAIIFFDEMEALGGSREAIAEHWSRALVNQFLIEMDAVEKHGERILVIGATNAPWYIDHALKRSGRFGESVFIGPPDLDEREEIFKLRSRKIARLDSIDYRKLAGMSADFSCADIDAICRETGTRVWLENAGRKVQTEDFVLTIERGTKEGRFKTVREWSDIAKRHDAGWMPSGSSTRKESMFG